MWWISLIWLIVVLAVVLVLVSSVVVTLELEHHGLETGGQARIVALYGLVRVTRELNELHPKWTKEGPAIKSVHEQVTSEDDQETTFTAREVWQVVRHWDTYAHAMRTMYRPLRRLLARVRMTTVDIQVCLGTGDAMSTGCLVGATWSGIGLVLGELAHLTRLTVRPQVVVTPDFSHVRLDLTVRCIGRIQVGHAIVGVVRMLLAWLRLKKTLPGQTSRPRKEEKTWSTPSRG